MKKLMGTVFSTLVAGLLAFASAQAWSSKGSQEVSSVDLKNGVIVIGDIQFKLTSATRVYMPTGSSGTLQQLRKGMKVRVNTVERTGSESSAISEIRIVPGD